MTDETFSRDQTSRDQTSRDQTMTIPQHSSNLAQAAEIQHPLEPLTAAEVQAAVALIQAKKK